MIRLCFATSSLGRGGAEKQLYLLLKHLDRNRYHPEVVTFSGGPWQSEIEELGIPVHILAGRSKFARFFSCVMHIFKSRPAVVHCFGASTGFIVRAAAVLLRVPTIIASERYSVETKNALKLWVEKILGFFTHYLVCNAQHSATYYSEHKIIRPSKIRIIKNAIEESELEPWTRPPSPTLGYLANLRAGKNHEFLLHAFKVVKSQVPGAKLLLAGAGNRRPFIEDLIAALGLSGSVEVLGSIDNQSAFFSRIAVYCHVSLFEGIPNSIMEAMARGIPCVASDIPGNRELILHEQTGILVNPASVSDFSSRVIALLNSPENAAVYGRAAKAMIHHDFTIAKMVELTTALYPR